MDGRMMPSGRGNRWAAGQVNCLTYLPSDAVSDFQSANGYATS